MPTVLPFMLAGCFAHLGVPSTQLLLECRDGAAVLGVSCVRVEHLYLLLLFINAESA